MTVYANLVDGEVKGVYDLLPSRWNNIDKFDIEAKLDENLMRENGFVKIIRDTTSYDPATHRMSDFPTYSVVDGEVYEHREITPIPVPTREEILQSVRFRRDRLIGEFQWRYDRYNREVRLGLTTTDDLTKMDAYIQALANITDTEDLNNIVWPVYDGPAATNYNIPFLFR